MTDVEEVTHRRRMIRTRARDVARVERSDVGGVPIVDSHGARDIDDDDVDERTPKEFERRLGSPSETHDEDISRALLEALMAMRATQVRMNAKLSWITRSLPKVYDAVTNECANAIEANTQAIDRVNAEVKMMRVDVMSESALGRMGRATQAMGGSTTTTSAAGAANAAAGEGDERDGGAILRSQSQSPTGTAIQWDRRRVVFDEIESDNEYVKNLPKLGHISAAGELSVPDKEYQQRAGYGPTSAKILKKKTAKLEDPRKWSREKWLSHLRAHSAQLFGTLDDLSIGEMVDSAKCLFVQRGARVVTQGERGDSMFVLVLGKMHVVVTQPGINRGESLQVQTLLQGDFFGEIALMTGDERRATVMAPYEGDGNVWVLEFSKRELGSVLLARQEVLRALTDVCANRKLESLA